MTCLLRLLTCVGAEGGGAGLKGPGKDLKGPGKDLPTHQIPLSVPKPLSLPVLPLLSPLQGPEPDGDS